MNRKELRKNELYTLNTGEGFIKGVCYSDTFVLTDPFAAVGRRNYLFKPCDSGLEKQFFSHLLTSSEVEEKVSYPNYSVSSLRYFPIDHNDLSACYWASKDRVNEFFDVSPMGDNLISFLLNGCEDELGLLIEQMERLKIDEIIKGTDDNAIISVNKVMYHARVKLRIVTEEVAPGLVSAFQKRLFGKIA